MQGIIVTDRLTKRYPVQKGYSGLLLHPLTKKETTALHNVNLTIRKGELFGLLGVNGAGKTTLIKILCTLVLPTSGKAFVNDLDVTKHEKEIKKIIGYVISDERSFYWRLSGRENLRFFAKLNNIPHSDADKKTEELLINLELIDDADKMFKDYSSGMRKKMAIARGLLTDPEIIFMDEPTNGLDPITARHFRKFIREQLVDKERRTVVFATHNLREAEDLCDRIAVIHRGEVRVEGTVGEIRGMFITNKRYVMNLYQTDNGILEKIRQLRLSQKIINVSDSVSSGNVTLEMEIPAGNGDIPLLIEQVIKMGGRVSSFYEKETPLEELFPKIVLKE